MMMSRETEQQRARPENGSGVRAYELQASEERTGLLFYTQSVGLY